MTWRAVELLAITTFTFVIGVECSLLCPSVPMCAEGGSGTWIRCSLIPRLSGNYMRSASTPADRSETRDALNGALSSLYGHDRFKPSIVDAVMRKLEHPDEPLVLHFAGDNGVGKTRTAELISIALSLGCHASSLGECAAGDALLSVASTSFPLEKWSAENITMHVSRLVARHAKRFPYGMVVFNDLPAFPRDVVTGIAPLLGGGGTPFSDFEPSKLLIVVTSDLGVERSSLWMSADELVEHVSNEFRWMFEPKNVDNRQLPSNALRNVVTIPFLPIDYSSAFRIVVNQLQLVKCGRHGRIVANVSYDDNVVLFILENEFANLQLENGRAVAKAASRHVDMVMRALELPKVQQPVDLHFFLDSERRTIGAQFALAAAQSDL